MSDLAAENSIDLLDASSSSRGDSSIPCYQLAMVCNECLLGIQPAKVEEIVVERCQPTCLMVTKQEKRPGNVRIDDHVPQGSEEEHQFSDAENGSKPFLASPDDLLTSSDFVDLPNKSRRSDCSCHEQTSCELIKNQEQDPKDTEEVCHTSDPGKIPTADDDFAQESQVSLDLSLIHI